MSLGRIYSSDENIFLTQNGGTPEKLFGVQSVDASWDIPFQSFNAAGHGMVAYESIGEIQGSINVSRFINQPSSEDPVINYAGGEGFLTGTLSGFFQYNSTNEEQAFSFKNAKISSYSSSCSVGGIASSDFSIISYGEMSSSSGTATIPTRSTVGTASAKNIFVELQGVSGNNGIQSYNLQVNLDWTALYGLGSIGQPVGYVLNYPIEVSLDFDMIVDEYTNPNVSGLICQAERDIQDITITVTTGCDASDAVNKFFIKNAQLQSTSYQANVNDNLNASLSYVAYIKQGSDISNLFPA
tara:strand:- start:1329 stop:2222 length:894 start_codon:yes stop_codon:yes gene_type:complete